MAFATRRSDLTWKRAASAPPVGAGRALGLRPWRASSIAGSPWLLRQGASLLVRGGFTAVSQVQVKTHSVLAPDNDPIVTITRPVIAMRLIAVPARLKVRRKAEYQHKPCLTFAIDDGHFTTNARENGSLGRCQFQNRIRETEVFGYFSPGGSHHLRNCFAQLMGFLTVHTFGWSSIILSPGVHEQSTLNDATTKISIIETIASLNYTIICHTALVILP